MERTHSQNDPSNGSTHSLLAHRKSASRQLKNDKEIIKSTWESRVRKSIGSAEAQSSISLRNSIEIFLDELVTTLEHYSLKSPGEGVNKGMTKGHGQQRAHLAGYYLPQLLMEFSILREVILEDMQNSECLTFDVQVIINGAIDAAISLAATEFTKTQQANVTTALEKAETSNKDLEQFAAVAAHDLKSPLATVSGYLDLLTEDKSDELDEESKRYIKVMLNACERMRNLVDRLLDYARLANRNNEFRLIDLNDVMASVLQNLHDAIQKTNAQVIYELLPTVYGDAELLSQVFQNLIANSIKFQGDQPPIIEIKHRADKDVFNFSLIDNGIGFDPQEKENIFDLYKKLRGESEYQGAGIGLATCKKVIELHGGQIWADSTPGVGSKFYFTLPKPSSSKADVSS